jgi:hypothetical protein
MYTLDGLSDFLLFLDLHIIQIVLDGSQTKYILDT